MAATVIMSGSCKRDERGSAYLTFSLSDDYSYPAMSRIFGKSYSLKSNLSLPDTNDFILSVISSDGKTIYKGAYRDRPEVMKVSPGSYDLSLVSIEFSEPKFETPQFGDFRTVILNEGEVLAVSFRCTQLNSGIRLLFTDSFKDRFSSGELCLKSDEYSLQYPYTEKRTAFFLPGILKLIYAENGSEQELVSYKLEPADMLTLNLSASMENSGGFKVSIDTARRWYTENYTIGSGNDGSSIENALEIGDLSAYNGAKDVWVAGYIVGGDLSSSKIKLEPPFTKDTHVAIAASASAATREECAAVELPKGAMRDELNLVAHPENLGKKLYVKGNIQDYYGYPGIKSVKDYKIE